MTLVVVLYSLFASMFTLAKLALEHTSPLFLVGIRMLTAASVLLGYQALRAPASLRIRGRPPGYWAKIAALGLSGIYITNAFEFWGLQFLTSFKACFIYSLSPFFSALLCYLLFSERLTRLKWLGLLIGFIGFIPVLGREGSADLSSLLSVSWPELAVMGAAAATVYGWIVLKDLVTHYGESPLLANGWSMLFGGLLSLGHSWLVEDWSPVPVSSYSPFLYYTGLMVLTSNLICYNLYGYLLRRFTATFLSFAGFMTPLFAAAYGTYFLDETVSWSFAFSALVVFCGLGLFYIEELREGGMHPVSKPESEMKSKAA